MPCSSVRDFSLPGDGPNRQAREAVLPENALRCLEERLCRLGEGDHESFVYSEINSTVAVALMCQAKVSNDHLIDWEVLLRLVV